MTRRARKHSRIAAVVLKWNYARKRYERQGLLVEKSALEKAEEECLADSEVRERRKLREAEKRTAVDQEYVESFAARIRTMFSRCPENESG